MEVRSILGTLVAAATATSTGCITGLSQGALARGRGDEVFGPPVRAWRLPGDRVIVECGPVAPGDCSPLALPLTGRDTPRSDVWLEYGAAEPDGRRAMIGWRWPPLHREWPAPTAQVVPLSSLPPLARGREGSGWYLVPQVALLPVTVALDLALAPISAIGLLWLAH